MKFNLRIEDSSWNAMDSWEKSLKINAQRNITSIDSSVVKVNRHQLKDRGFIPNTDRLLCHGRLNPISVLSSGYHVLFWVGNAAEARK
jgi:hypothetical protein